jgi:phosphatidylinositol alpha-1,6-mannosyltransferase
MKTLLLTFDYPPIIGGIANVLATFTRLASGPECVILAPAGKGAKELDASHPVRTIRYPTFSEKHLIGKLLNLASAAVWTVMWVVYHRPRILIAGQVVRAGPIAYLWHRMTGRPFYLWVFGGETDPAFTPSSFFTRFLHRILRAACVVFTNSPFTSMEMKRFGIPEERVVELPRGVDKRDYYPTERNPQYVERYGLEDKLVFMTLGRLVERKGIDMMLEALSGLAEDLPPWHYLVVSDGPDRERLETLAEKLELRDHVTFTGYVERHELPIYYNLCDIFAMPNRKVSGTNTLSIEGFGTVFVEAAACAKPVIAGRSGGAVFAVDDRVNGILVDSTDLDDIKRAIHSLMDRETREKMSAAGVEFAKRFDWERSAEILRSYLDEPA